jgi:dCMP deaminase
MESINSHILTEIERISKSSKCVRRQFCSIVFNPFSVETVSKGINKSKVKGLCGGQKCLRDVENVKSGSNLSLGCIHAEDDAIQKALDIYKSIHGFWLYINGEPCLNCAKLIIKYGISHVFYKKGVYPSQDGIDLLKKQNVKVIPYSF